MHTVSPQLVGAGSHTPMEKGDFTMYFEYFCDSLLFTVFIYCDMHATYMLYVCNTMTDIHICLHTNLSVSESESY